MKSAWRKRISILFVKNDIQALCVTCGHQSTCIVYCVVLCHSTMVWTDTSVSRSTWLCIQLPARSDVTLPPAIRGTTTALPPSLSYSLFAVGIQHWFLLHADQTIFPSSLGLVTWICKEENNNSCLALKVYTMTCTFALLYYLIQWHLLWHKII